MSNIYYTGSKSDWNNIDIDYSYTPGVEIFSNPELKDVNMYFNSTMPTDGSDSEQEKLTPEIVEVSTGISGFGDMIVDAKIDDVPAGAAVFAAAYDGDSGEFLAVSKMSRIAKTSFTCYPGLYDVYERLIVKVFVWDDSTSMRPLCTPMETETSFDY